MRIELISSWDEVDGMAEYARNLVNSVPGVEFMVHGKPFAIDDQFPGDVVHLNHEHHLMKVWDEEAARQLKAWGKKTVLTYHNSRSEKKCATEFTQLWDRVVVHEKNQDGFVHIPQGIPVWENTRGIEPQNKIGWSGFPCGHKGLDFIAQVAQDLGVGLLAICPESRWGDAKGTKEFIEGVCPRAEVVTDFLPTEQVINRLAECVVTVYLHKGDNPGISASVRMGLATGRPIVISQNRQFHDLWEDYGDEIYLVNDPLPTYKHVRTVVEEALTDQKKKPKRILEDMNWNRCGQMYKDVYEELIA